MCTLSWNWGHASFHLFFNRDESLERAEAIPPKLVDHDGVKILAPIDSQASGTWLGVNDHGLVVAIVNDYQGSNSVSHSKLRSRGLLVIDALKNESVETFHDWFRQLDLSVYQGFLLHAFDLNQKGMQLHWCGNGDVVLNEDITQPVSSSSKYPTEAKSYRQEIFRSDFKLSEQRNFHAFHDVANPALSPWMVRDDAKTQSYTEIEVSAGQAKMWYGKTFDQAKQKSSFDLKLYE